MGKLVKTLRSLAFSDSADASVQMVHEVLSGVKTRNLSRVPQSILLNCVARYVDLDITFPEQLRLAIDEAEDYARRFGELAKLFATEGPEDRDLGLLVWLSLAGLLPSCVKEAVTLLQAKWVGEAYDTSSPVGMSVFPRSLKVHLQRSLSKRARKSAIGMWTLQTAIQGLKKGLLTLRPAAVCESLAKHHKALSKPFAVSPARVDRIVELAEGVLKFSSSDARGQDLFKYTKSATIERSRGRRGNYGWLVENSRTDNDLISAHVLYGYLGRANPKAVYGPDFEDLVHLRTRQFYQDVDLQAEEKHHSVEPYPILEPLKVRMITKPAVMQYQGLKALQAAGWRRLFSHPTGAFTPIGEMFSQEHLSGLLRAWQPGKKFVSGDYSQATDRLPTVVTDSLFPVLYGPIHEKMLAIKGLGPCWYNVLTKQMSDGLGHAKIEYCGDWFAQRAAEDGIEFDEIQLLQAANRDLLEYFKKIHEETGEGQLWIGKLVGECPDLELIKWRYTIEQRNGQLMGHPLSFPLLCLWNYVNLLDVWMAEKNIAVDEYTSLSQWAHILVSFTDDTGVLICGDDIAFVATPCLYNAWKRRVSEYGMVLSPGKNFFSDEYVQFCSQTYHVDTWNVGGNEFPTYVVSGVRIAKYTNFGYITSRKKQDAARDLSLHTDLLDIDDVVLARIPVLPKLYDELIADCPRNALEALHDVLSHSWKPFFSRFPRLKWGGLMSGPDSIERRVLNEQLKGIYKDSTEVSNWHALRRMEADWYDPVYTPYASYSKVIRKSFVKSAWERSAMSSAYHGQDELVTDENWQSWRLLVRDDISDTRYNYAKRLVDVRSEELEVTQYFSPAEEAPFLPASKRHVNPNLLKTVSDQ